MRIDILSGDDWVAVYKDGHKVHEGHSCSLRDGLEALGIESFHQEVEPEGITDEFGHDPSFWTGSEFPESLSTS